MRRVTVIASFLLVLSAEAQSGQTWLRRWVVEQGEASVTLARLRFEETATYQMEGAFGPHEMVVVSGVVVDRSLGVPLRTMREVQTGNRRIRPDQGRQGRRFRSPVRQDLMMAVDRLLFPTMLINELHTSGRINRERVGGRELIRVLTVADSEDSAVERVTWLFDRAEGRLIQARAIIRGEERGTLVAEVTYGRIDGLDLPLSRTLSGSFAMRRRTRTFTVLVDGNSTFALTSLESLE